jgi:hypothetical protein
MFAKSPGARPAISFRLRVNNGIDALNFRCLILRGKGTLIAGFRMPKADIARGSEIISAHRRINQGV